MTTDATLTLAQWFSPGFPIGAFSYSHGLEWVIEAGGITSAKDAQDWTHALLTQGSGRNDMLFIHAAYHAETSAELVELNDLCVGFCSAEGRVIETCEQGSAFCRTLRDMGQADLETLAFPVAVGRAARLCALPIDQTLRFYLHAFAANLISAMVRRVPLGQTEGQRVLHDLQAPITQMVADLDQPTTDDLSSITFAADIAAMNHETLYSKTFRT